MKRSVFILFVLILFSFPLISAVEIEMKENFNSGETLTAKVSANFIQPITKENVFFYRGNILDSNFQISLDYDVIKIGEDFYIYAILSDKTEGDYSVAIENAQYMKGAKISGEKIVKNFSINSQTADFYVKPGVIKTSEDFSVEVQNLNENNIIININTETNVSGVREILIDGSKTSSLSLKSGEIKKINFQLGAGESALRTIELKTENLIYEIPVYIEISGEEIISGTPFSFEPSELNFSLPTNSAVKKTVYLYNSGNNNLENISLSLSSSLSGFATISETLIENLDAHSSTSVELSLFSPTEKKVAGELNAEIGNVTISSSVYLQFSTNYVPSNETYSSEKTCVELNGTLYNTQTEKCSAEPIYAKDNICCLGNIGKIKTNDNGKIIAAILIAVVIAGLLWFYFARYRKTKSRVAFLKAALKKF